MTRSNMSARPSLFRLISAVNGWSLVVAGGLSLIVSLFATAWAGVLVSLAAAAHGTFELLLRKKMAGEDRVAIARRMALNQLGLAASLSLYFAYQFATLDAAALSEMILKSPLYDELVLYSDLTGIQIFSSLPTIVGVSYAVAAAVAWLVCGGTALYYWLQGKGAADVSKLDRVE